MTATGWTPLLPKGGSYGRASRPNATSIVAIRNVRFTSIRDIESVATTFRFGSKAVIADRMAIVSKGR
jgi:hypothetical protein